MMNNFMNGMAAIMGYFLGTALVIIFVIIGIHFHKTVLGIYKIEREIQQIHQRLEEKPPVDKNEVQNRGKMA